MKQQMKILSWLLVIVWMYIIFGFSAQTGEESSRMSQVVTDILSAIIQNADWEDRLHFLIRKCAHAGEYYILGLLTVNAIRTSGFQGRKIIWYPFIICILFACGDEFHQLFVPDRTAKIADILIDSTGAFLGVTTWNLIARRRESVKSFKEK